MHNQHVAIFVQDVMMRSQTTSSHMRCTSRRRRCGRDVEWGMEDGGWMMDDESSEGEDEDEDEDLKALAEFGA